MRLLSRNGFSLYLTFLITTVLFILVSATYEIATFSMDLGRSTSLDVASFHAADGGLERGLARLYKKFQPFQLSYSTDLSRYRKVVVQVVGRKVGKDMTVESAATVFDGKKAVTTRRLLRKEVKKLLGRSNSGYFLEAS